MALMSQAVRGTREMPQSRTGAVLIDKDGTLLENVPYNVNPDLMRLMPGAGRALTELGRLGVPLVVVTNQAGVALGHFDVEALAAVEHRLAEMFADHGARLAAMLHCPHHPVGTVPRYARPCLCRKPMPGMLLQAASRLRFDIRRSWMIGDILDDIEAGRRAGCRTVLVDYGNETEWQVTPMRRPHFVVQTMEAAAAIVVRGMCLGRMAPPTP